MKERPILFSGEMVRAILDGRKTQTRRIVKPRHVGGVITGQASQPFCAIEGWGGGAWHVPAHMECRPCPYGAPGDWLWVRETWHLCPKKDNERYCYRADHSSGCGTDSEPTLWKPSIFMPRWASRITLEIVNVRVERLNDISQSDALAEGGPPSHPSIDSVSREYGYADFSRSWYAQLWERINGPGSWARNPWVWALTFKRVTQ